MCINFSAGGYSVEVILTKFLSAYDSVNSYIRKGMISTIAANNGREHKLVLQRYTHVVWIFLE